MVKKTNMTKLPTESEVSWNAARQVLTANGRLSVVMPAFNLGPKIKANIEQVAQTFRGKIPFEIVAVSDGSLDETWSEIEKARTVCSELIPVNMTENHGKGHALREGFAQSTGSYILFLDADLDLPAYQTAWFFEKMKRSGSDIVIGAKRHPHSELIYPLKRRIISGGYYLLVRVLFGLPVRDTQTGIKLFKREVLEAVMPRMLVKRFAFDLELLVIARHLGFSISEAPVVLNFHGSYGCVSRTTVRKIMNDTLAIFYRLYIKRYYDRNHSFVNL